MALRHTSRWVHIVLAAVLVGACSGAGAPSAGAARLTVLAAASLRQSFERLRDRYREVAPGVSMTMAFEASSAHRARIEQGAQADIFASADLANPQKLVDAGMAAGPPRAFAGNRLAIVTPSDDPGRVASAEDLARPGVRIVAAGATVPITSYAVECVAKLATLPGYPPGFADRVAANVVTREDDVAAVVAKIELGEGDAAIVYATDAAPITRLRIVPIPEEANVIARYAAVRLDASQDRLAADAFLDWLTGADARTELRAFGFSDPSP